MHSLCSVLLTDSANPFLFVDESFFWGVMPKQRRQVAHNAHEPMYVLRSLSGIPFVAKCLRL